MREKLRRVSARSKSNTFWPQCALQICPLIGFLCSTTKKMTYASEEYCRWDDKKINRVNRTSPVVCIPNRAQVFARPSRSIGWRLRGIQSACCSNSLWQRTRVFVFYDEFSSDRSVRKVYNQWSQSKLQATTSAAIASNPFFVFIPAILTI